MKIRLACWLPFLVVAMACGVAVAGTALKSGPGLHSAMPAGYDVMQLKPSGMLLSLMGLIECTEVEGAQHVAAGSKSKLLSADGEVIRRFPRHFSFRITASLRKILLDPPEHSLEFAGDPRDLLLHLRFRIKAYNGLEMREIASESIDLIGMPADVSYDERIYRVRVKTGDMPVTNRIVIEVLSPEGEVLTHFPFDLL
jgi:hypothetical protein